MNKKIFMVAGAVSLLALTGCSKGIEDIDSDTPKAERDEIFVAWVEENYGDTYPNLTPEELPEVGEGMCLAYDTGLEGFVYMSMLEEVPEEDVSAVRDILSTSVRVYCPEHVS